MVTIVVPVYNISKYLPACVESLQKQTCEDLEIILVDDGSTDGSGALCDEYAAADPRIRVVHKENGGLSSARNAGLDVATGQWVLFVDGDDYLVRDAAELLLDVVKLHQDADFVHFLYQETDGSWQPEEQLPGTTVLTDVPDFFQYLYDMGGVAASACTKLFRKELLDSLRFKEGIRHEDEELMTRLLPKCRKVVYTNLLLYGYVMRQGSIVHSQFSPKAMDIFPIMDDRIHVLQQLGCDDLAIETQCRMFQTAAWQYCFARKGGFRTEAAQLKKIILACAKEKNLPLNGQYRILHRLAGKFPLAVEMYYFIRRLSNKT
jgi:glycosyltransferase involved in cell wall biosynthesis